MGSPESTGIPENAIPGFQLLGLIGQGGMGVVFKARHLDSDRLVALKMLLNHATTNAVRLARFRLEAEAVACLALPSVVKILGFGLVDDCPYMLLEYISGGSLAAKIGSTAQLPRWSAEVAFQLATTMEQVHQRGIIHRDLKPANVLLSPEGRPMITDFGLAKFAQPFKEVVDRFNDPYGKFHTLRDDVYEELLERYYKLDPDQRETFDQDSPASDARHEEFEQFVVASVLEDLFPGQANPDATGLRESAITLLRDFRERGVERSGQVAERWHELTRVGQIMGTPCYMAPEQATGATCGPQTDVYALGAILYQMLTARLPFTGSNPLDILMSVVQRRPEPIEEPVSRELTAICMKCLEKKVESRYQSSGELADDLQRFLDGYTVHAPRDWGRTTDSALPPNLAGQEERLTVSYHPVDSQEKPPETRSWWRFWR